MKNREIQGKVMVFSAGVLWGSIGVFVKLMERQGATPVLTCFLRVFFAFSIMLAACVIKFGWRSLIVGKKTLFVCFCLGVICHGICLICNSYAVVTVGVSISAVLMYIAPAFTTIFAVLFFREKLNAEKCALVVITILGCILTATNGQIDTATFSLRGFLYGIGAGLCYSLTAIIGRIASDRTNPFVVSVYSYFFASLFLFLFLRPWAEPITIRAPLLGLGFAFALVPSAIGYTLYYMGLHLVRDSSNVPVLASIELVSATFLGIILFNERLGIISVIGIVLVLLPATITMLDIRHTLPQLVFRFIRRRKRIH